MCGGRGSWEKAPRRAGRGCRRARGVLFQQNNGEACIQSIRCKSRCCQRDPNNCESHCTNKGSEDDWCHTQVGEAQRWGWGLLGRGGGEAGGKYRNREPGRPRAQGREEGVSGQQRPELVILCCACISKPPVAWGSRGQTQGGSQEAWQCFPLTWVPVLRGSSQQTLKGAL